jgi:hypothetical protein
MTTCPSCGATTDSETKEQLIARVRAILQE